MKKILSTIFIILAVTMVVGVATVPQQANAGFMSTLACINNLTACGTKMVVGNIINLFVAELGNLILWISSQFIALTASLLNISIILTMNIKALYDATPAIEQVWIVIRNISSIFIIFGLLYTSIMTILDMKNPGIGNMVKNIVIAGLFINFSLFFTKVAIDASNLISLSIYRSIAPSTQNYQIGKDGIGKILSNNFLDENGLSNVFMQSLKVTSIYDPKNKLSNDSDANTLLIIISTVLGTVLMFLTALSFLAASIAFIVRIVILLLLLGFSPVYFIGIIFPEIQSNISKKWEKYLTQELIFMPAYLLFMYVALSFISTTNGGGFFGALDANRIGSGTMTTAYVGLVLQFTIAFILINIPLIAALQLGGIGAKWGETARNWMSGKVGGVIGRNTAGRLSKNAGKLFDNMAARVDQGDSRFLKGTASILRATNISQGVRGQLKDWEGSKYGSSYSLEDIKKDNKERSKIISGLQRSNKQQKAINAALSNKGADPELVGTLAKEVGKMNVKEFEKIDYVKLKDPNFIWHLSSSQFDKLIESDSLNDKQKDELKEVRKTAFNAMLSPGSPLTKDALKDRIKLLTGKDLMKLNSTIFNNNNVVDNLTPSQLKEMTDLDQSVRLTIAQRISGLPANTHKAQGFIKKNSNEWPTS